MSDLKGYTQLRARFEALRGEQKMRLLANAAAGELKRNSPGQKTRLTANSIVVSSVSATSARIIGSGVNVFLDQGTGIYGPLRRRITPKAAKALRWMGGGPSKVRLSGASRMVAGKARGDVRFAKSVKGMKGRPFIKRSLEAVGGRVGLEIIYKAWNEAS